MSAQNQTSSRSFLVCLLFSFSDGRLLQCPGLYVGMLQLRPSWLCLGRAGVAELLEWVTPATGPCELGAACRQGSSPRLPSATCGP